MDTADTARSALTWMREAELLRGEAGEKALKRAVWEDLTVEPMDVGLVLVRNESHDDPNSHCHEVSVERSSGIVHYCSCAQFTFREQACKHMVAVALALDGGDLPLASVGAEAAEDGAQQHGKPARH